MLTFKTAQYKIFKHVLILKFNDVFDMDYTLSLLFKNKKTLLHKMVHRFPIDMIY